MPITPRLFAARGRARAAALGIDPDRLPPGQSPTVKWPVLSLGETPRVDTARWLLSVDGAVQAPYALGWAELQALPQTKWRGDIHCVTRWSKFDMDWRGVSVGELLERAQPRPEASHLLAHCYGGYTTNMPLSDVLEHPALIAHTVGGAPLEPDHGGPARLLVPHLYLWKSAKWIHRLELLTEDHLGFWERNGYHHRGDPWGEERYSVEEYVARAMRRAARSRADRLD
ncbi:MAG TPA: sulfite oxidase-like oxidoreductase [Solirubrobacteraceae bacterium]|nr:sulfite oxidase-like oxidoreductase [Solirubrobacteraceae bacterium]